jgi:ribosomal protein L15
LTKVVKVITDRISDNAREKIEAIGGSVIMLVSN